MSRSHESQLAKMSDANIDISVEKEACPLNIAPTSSTTLTLALGDALAVALMHIRGFKKEDFARFHPAGALGKRLFLKVEHFLKEPKDLPIVEPETPLKEAVITMSTGRLGNIIIAKNGVLQGVFSDGDLRRSLLNDGFDFNAPISKYMTKEPFVISNTKMQAVDALKLIEAKRIQLLIVVDENKRVVGALHLHDLLEAGVEK